MTIQEMHYDFKRKINKIDSSQNRNLLIPEIDTFLNEAQELYVKMVAKPLDTKSLGFETTQRVTDNIAPLVVHDKQIEVTPQDIVPLPSDYWFFLKGYLTLSKATCKGVRATFHIRQHDDTFENSPYDCSSFEWRTVNGVFTDKGIQLYNDGTFTNDKFYLSYLRRLKTVHYAEGFSPIGYTTLANETLTGTSDCELPFSTHREIVDLAVAIAMGDMGNPYLAVAMNKLKFNNLNPDRPVQYAQPTTPQA